MTMVGSSDAPEIIDDFEIGQVEAIHIKDKEANKQKLRRCKCICRDKKGFANFALDFLTGGASAAVSKTVAAPIERVKLLIQNQDKMIKSGCLYAIQGCCGMLQMATGNGSLFPSTFIFFVPSYYLFDQVIFCTRRSHIQFN
ncbi:hypothetical protein IFM89_029275 [Coptis chinensis]|uniref:ADP/ATP translocase n=1 Tax=Coptis chinensis TaxID=261450 RepID=A0A835LSS3_9MAGN|nr:hypothetical protein IFM89_029275 [Coptis chinensis]